VTATRTNFEETDSEVSSSEASASSEEGSEEEESEDESESDSGEENSVGEDRVSQLQRQAVEAQSRAERWVQQSQATVPSATMSELTLVNDPFGILAYCEDETVVITNEDRYSAAQCAEVFERWLSKYVPDRNERGRVFAENALAEVCCKGTSAKRFNTRARISVPSIKLECTLGEFVAFLPVDRDNNLRVWCESRVGFADRTYHLIAAKDALRVDVSKSSTCSLELAPVGFDYAGALSANVYKQLGAVERQFIAQNTTRKAGPARSHVFEGERTDSGTMNLAPNEAKAEQARVMPAPTKSSLGGLYGR